MPKVDSQITIGNMVSWALVVIAFVTGFVKLQEASAQNARDVVEAKSIAVRASERLTASDLVRQADIGALKTDIAVIKSNVLTMNEKIDEIRRNQK